MKVRRALRGTLAGALAATGIGAAAAAPAPAASPIWRLEQPAPPAGAPFKVPLGAPGDLEFYAPNRGLLAVEGNSVVPRGIYSWNGVSWHELATVCGGSGDTTRIAFAGPDEFWTVSPPSEPRRGDGTALCHFKNGEVVDSFSTAPESPDPYHTMDSAACNGPADCWFGGFGAQDPTGERAGAFHLHWDGHALETVYAPQGRGVSDLVFHHGTFFETTFAGRAPEDRQGTVDLANPESHPALIHRIDHGVFSNDPFTPIDPPGTPPDGAELLAAGHDATDLWAVGGGAASGPAAPEGGSVARPPLAARLTPAGFQEVPIDPAAFGPTDRFVGVAPIPGSTSAWVAAQRFSDRRSTNAKATVARVDPAGTVTTTRLPVSGSGRGSAARIAFTGPNDGWMVTTAGWLFHYTDGTSQTRDTDPNFSGRIDYRPNEAQAQSVPDSPPVDDSQLFAPPVRVHQHPQKRPRPRRLPPLLRHVHSKLHGLTLVLSFQLTRRARVGLVARRHGRVVARTGVRQMRPGRHVLRLKLSRRRFPTALAFEVRETPSRRHNPRHGGGGGSGPTVV